MSKSFRLSVLVEYLRGSLWFLPTVSVLVAVAAAITFARVDVPSDTFIARIVFGGGPSGARGMLQAVAGSVITVTTLVFSLTVVTLQLASSQFSPRLLRTFLRDLSNQVVLSVFLATFAYCLTLLRFIRGEGPETALFVPQTGVTVGFLLALASLAALVYFLQHITQSLRIEALMQEVEEDAVEVLDRVHPTSAGEPGAEDEQARMLPEVPARAVAVTASGSGFLTAVNTGTVREHAERHDLVVRFAVEVGSYVIADAPLAWVWSRTESGGDSEDKAVAAVVRRSVALSFERTLQQDVAFGLRQLVDVASKALSPGINDPTTALDAVGHIGSLMVRLAGRVVAPLVAHDAAGIARVALPRPAFGDYLALACDQIRRFAAEQPEVLVALLGMLGQVGANTSTPGQRSAVEEQIALVVAAAERSLAEERDVMLVSTAAANARRALDGDRRP